MENFIKNHIEQEIRKKKYKLSVGLVKLDDDSKSYIVTIYGGANGHGRLTRYLSEIKDIVDLFNEVYMVNWNSDLLDDLFSITLLIKL